MTEEVFREDAYRRETPARVTAVDAAGIRLDRTVFYPRGGGQAGDAGVLVLAGGEELAIADTIKAPPPSGEGRDILHVPAPGQEGIIQGLRIGDAVTARIDWERRHRHMRFHTATH